MKAGTKRGPYKKKEELVIQAVEQAQNVQNLADAGIVPQAQADRAAVVAENIIQEANNAPSIFEFENEENQGNPSGYRFTEEGTLGFGLVGGARHRRVGRPSKKNAMAYLRRHSSARKSASKRRSSGKSHVSFGRKRSSTKSARGLVGGLVGGMVGGLYDFSKISAKRLKEYGLTSKNKKKFVKNPKLGAYQNFVKQRQAGYRKMLEKDGYEGRELNKLVFQAIGEEWRGLTKGLPQLKRSSSKKRSSHRKRGGAIADEEYAMILNRVNHPYSMHPMY